MRRVLWLAAIPLLLPVGAAALLSLSSSTSLDVLASHSFSLRWWKALVHDRAWPAAIVGSSIVAFSSAFAAIVVSTPAVVAIRLCADPRFKAPLYASAVTLGLPPVVLALGLYRFVSWVDLFDTMLGLVLSHMALTVPVAALSLHSQVTCTPLSIMQAARSLGAGPLRACATWFWATQKRAVVATGATAFLVSISEATITTFVTDFQVQTITRRALSGLSRDFDPSGLAALTAWTILVTILFVAFVRIGGRERATSSRRAEPADGLES